MTLDAPQDPPPPPPIDPAAGVKLGRARKWLLGISILTLVSGVVIYFIQKARVEDQIRSAAAQLAGLDPATRDATLQAKLGMTWAQVQHHDRMLVTMVLVVNLALAAFYLLMWAWARREPLRATVLALLVFVGAMAVNGWYDPHTLSQGLVVKVLFIVALSRAIGAARLERRAAAYLAPARLGR